MATTETLPVTFIFGYCGTLGSEEQNWTREEIARALGSQEWKIDDGMIWCRMHDTFTHVEIGQKQIKLFSDEEYEELMEVHTEHRSETHGCEWDFE